MGMFGMLGLLVQLVFVGGIIAAIVYALRRRSAGAVGNTVNPRDVFIYVLTTIALYLTAAGSMMIVDGLANSWFPVFNRTFGTGSARAGISMVIVAFPILAYLTRLIRRKIRGGEIEPHSRVRDGFAYFSLFIVAVIALVDLMVIVNVLLSGEVTGRFLVKAIGLLVIVGLIFRYYQVDLVAGDDEPPPVPPVESEVAA